MLAATKFLLGVVSKYLNYLCYVEGGFKFLSKGLTNEWIVSSESKKFHEQQYNLL